MSIHCTATYESGVLRLDGPVSLREGERVEVIVISERPAAEPSKAAEALAAIAAFPLEVEVDDPGFSGRDQDQVLYGEHGAR